MKLTNAVLSAIISATAVLGEDAVFKPTSIKAPFIEQFTEGWDQRWRVSEAVKQGVEGSADGNEELYRYRGEWSVEPAVKDALAGKEGLVAKTPAAHHAISVAFDTPVDPTDKDFVVQYELKLQDELQCGGAYIKLLTESPSGIQYKEFDDKTPYTIMFGPDKCGSTNKVHFIFRHQSPVTQEWEEKHFKNTPSIKDDAKTHLYTLYVRPNNSFEMYIDKVRVKFGTLLEDFSPAVNPPALIDDPKDKKPGDWVDDPKMPDPHATKPADWDEFAPKTIPDEDAEIPEDWLEDEPEFVSDPDALQPEDWDEDEDGTWGAPQIPNPKCEKVSGCGKWERPQKPNPAYKGKWYPPMIDNPDYKGAWEPKKIKNPLFFEDLKPSKFTKIMGIGIEIWTMQAGIMFDSFYVGHSLDDAFQLADESFALKKKIEDASAEEEQAKEDEAAEENNPDKDKFATKAKKQWDKISVLLNEFMAAAVVDPVEAFKTYPVTGASVVFAFLAPTILYFLLGGSSKKNEVEKEEKEEKDDQAKKDD